MDYIVLKRTGGTGDRGEDWQPVVIARGVDHEEAAAKQAYSGEGTYKVLPWDDDAEVAVRPGEPQVTMVSKREVAEVAAGAEAEAVKDGK
jgi:hypothetical protein